MWSWGEGVGKKLALVNRVIARPRWSPSDLFVTPLLHGRSQLSKALGDDRRLLGVFLGGKICEELLELGTSFEHGLVSQRLVLEKLRGALNSLWQGERFAA